MTYDKAVHYINNPKIVDAIKEANQEQLVIWLKELEFHLSLFYPKGECSYPINYIAEKELIQKRIAA